MSSYEPLGYTFNDDNWQNPNKTEEEKKELSFRGTVLSQWQNLPLNIKIQMAERRIRALVDQYGKDNIALNFSGGKDSTILSDIAFNMGYKFTHIYFNTRLEYIDCYNFTKEYCKQRNIDLIILSPNIKPKEIWDKYGYPLFGKEIAETLERLRLKQKVCPRKLNKALGFIQYKDLPITAKCCDLLKKKPIKKYIKNGGLKVFLLGTRAEESLLRRRAWLRKGCIYEHSNSQVICTPIIMFTEKDLYQYVSLKKIRLAEIYYKGIKRNGCYCCGFGCHLNSNNNFTILKRLYPKLWHGVMYKWGFKNILDKCHITTGSGYTFIDKYGVD